MRNRRIVWPRCLWSLILLLVVSTATATGADTGSRPLRAEFGGGRFIELVAICRVTLEDQVQNGIAWGPDGTPTEVVPERGPTITLRGVTGFQPLRFLFRHNIPEAPQEDILADQTLRWRVQPSGQQVGQEMDPSFGTRPKELDGKWFVQAALVPEEATGAFVSVRLPVDRWNTVLRISRNDVERLTHWGCSDRSQVLITGLRQNGSDVWLTIVHPETHGDVGTRIRVAAVDASGNVHASEFRQSASIDERRILADLCLPNLDVDSIRELRVQKPEFRWVVFHHLAIRAGQTTEPKAEILIHAQDALGETPAAELPIPADLLPPPQTLAVLDREEQTQISFDRPVGATVRRLHQENSIPFVLQRWHGVNVRNGDRSAFRFSNVPDQPSRAFEATVHVHHLTPFEEKTYGPRGAVPIDLEPRDFAQAAEGRTVVKVIYHSHPRLRAFGWRKRGVLSGTSDDLEELIEQAHHRGIPVVTVHLTRSTGVD